MLLLDISLLNMLFLYNNIIMESSILMIAIFVTFSDKEIIDNLLAKINNKKNHKHYNILLT